jgi:hypothetical protein
MFFALIPLAMKRCPQQSSMQIGSAVPRMRWFNSLKLRFRADMVIVPLLPEHKKGVHQIQGDANLWFDTPAYLMNAFVL